MGTELAPIPKIQTFTLKASATKANPPIGAAAFVTETYAMWQTPIRFKVSKAKKINLATLFELISAASDPARLISQKDVAKEKALSPSKLSITKVITDEPAIAMKILDLDTKPTTPFLRLCLRLQLPAKRHLLY